ncbi:MAG: cobalamin B12-binding domain-containing protein [Nitrospirae bacterium]|nr:cobalamin B12-binding domain-containing protein [Nitrospirota bacterium]
MSCVILIHLAFDPPSGHVDKKIRYQRIQRRPQLGLQYIAAVLENLGHATEIWDQAVERFTMESLLARMSRTKPLFFGYYSHSFVRDKLCRHLRQIKPIVSSKLIVGGPGALHAKDFLEAGADGVVRGEAEAVLPALVRFCGGEIPGGSVPSFAFFEPGGIHSTPTATPIADLDTLPYPKREPFQPDAYHDYFIPTMRSPYATLITSRGCPYTCTFCGSPTQWGHKVRQRSVENVLSEEQKGRVPAWCPLCPTLQPAPAHRATHRATRGCAFCTPTASAAREKRNSSDS